MSLNGDVSNDDGLFPLVKPISLLEYINEVVVTDVPSSEPKRIGPVRGEGDGDRLANSAEPMTKSTPQINGLAIVKK